MEVTQIKSYVSGIIITITIIVLLLIIGIELGARNGKDTEILFEILILIEKVLSRVFILTICLIILLATLYR